MRVAEATAAYKEASKEGDEAGEALSSSSIRPPYLNLHPPDHWTAARRG